MTTINGGNPVTAFVDIARTSNRQPSTTDGAKAVDSASSLVTGAAVNQSNVKPAQAQRVIGQTPNDIPSDVIRVSSSLGQADIRGNLTRSQASEIYEKISKLI